MDGGVTLDMARRGLTANRRSVTVSWGRPLQFLVPRLLWTDLASKDDGYALVPRWSLGSIAVERSERAGGNASFADIATKLSDRQFLIVPGTTAQPTPHALPNPPRASDALPVFTPISLSRRIFSGDWA